MAKPNDIAVRADILARRGNGETYESIARDYDVTKGGIRQMVVNHEDTVRQIKERIFADNIDNYTESLKQDVENSRTIANKYKETGKIEPAEVAYKTTVNKAFAPVMVDRGIHPNNAFIQMNIDNSKNINVDEGVFKALSKGFNTGFVQMHDVKEIEIEEEK